MISIASDWQRYFEDPDEGLGTTYERFILHRHFEKIKEQFSVRNVLEIPSFGMTGISGINSMWWALHGIPVTVVDEEKERLDLMRRVWNETALKADFVYQPRDQMTLPFQDKSFDMGWTFASLWFVSDLESFLKELTRITKSVIFICVPNRLGLGFISRFIFQKNHESGLHRQNIIPGRIKKVMLKLHWSVLEQGFLDIPPWPDIAMKKEDLLQKLGLKGFSDRFRNGGRNGMCILDYYSEKNMNMDKEILRYAFLEDAPWIFKRFWAHHWYALFSPR
jgi:hypothetical protein